MDTLCENRYVVGEFGLGQSWEDPDYDKLVEEQWRLIPAELLTRTFAHKGSTVTVTPDWRPVQTLMHNQIRTGNRTPKKLNVPIQVAVDIPNDYCERSWYWCFFAESYLYDFFIAMNLALPGAADFFNLRVEPGEFIRPEKLDLSAFYFDSAFRNQEQWPPLRRLSLQTAASWYLRARPGYVQVPDSPVERAIFAIIHVTRSSGRPEDIVWLFYAFESLFQTRVGENFSALLERICLLLQPNSSEEKYLRKQMRAMYEFRSAFVHGGLSVIHPMHNEIMDRRVENSYHQTIDLSEYAIRVLVACLQRYIDNDWLEVRYRTTIEAISDES